MISELMQEVSEIKRNKRTTDLIEDNEIDSIFKKFQSPINSEQDLQNFENALQDSAVFNKTVCNNCFLYLCIIVIPLNRKHL